MPLDPDKVKTYDALSIIFGRLLLTLILAGILIAVAVVLLRHQNWPMAALEAFLAGTCYRMVKFYFPIGEKARGKGKTK